MENFYTSNVHIYIFTILFHHSLDNDWSTVERSCLIILLLKITETFLNTSRDENSTVRPHDDNIQPPSEWILKVEVHRQCKTDNL